MWTFLLAQAFCGPNFPLDLQHPQMETWGTSDVPSIHSAAPATSDLMPKRKTMIEDTLFILHYSFYLSVRKRPIMFGQKHKCHVSLQLPLKRKYQLNYRKQQHL